MDAEQAFRALVRDVKAYDDELDDSENEGRNAQPPTGDDYNELFEMVMEHARKAGLL
jgi:hypothetical protein